MGQYTGDTRVERRHHTRHSVDLDAQLLRPGMGAIAGAIRDVCDGGIFMALDPAVVSRQEPIDIGESVQVKFSAHLDGNKLEYRIRARVAGTFKHGVGCEFFDADDDALAALRRIAREAPAPGVEAPAGAGDENAGATPAIEDAPQIIERCKHIATDFLAPHIGALFTSAEEHLFLMARDAKSNDEQNHFFDMIKELEPLKEAVQSSFYDFVVGHMDTLGAPLPSMQEPEEEESAGGLSLVESGEFADWLATKQIHGRAEPRLRDRIFQLNQRLSALINAKIDDDNNPVGLAGLCYTFHDAIQTIDSPRVVRRVIFDVFDEHIVGDLGDLYDALNEHLIEAGVLPSIEAPSPEAAKKRQAEAGQSEAGEPAPQSAIEPTPSVEEEDATSWVQMPDAVTVQGQAQPDPSTLWDPRAQGTAPAGTVPGHAAVPSAFTQPAAAPAAFATPAHGAGVPVAEMPDSSIPEPPAQDMAPHPSLVGGPAFDPRTAVTGHLYSSPMDVTLSAYQTARSVRGVRAALATAAAGAAPEPALPAYAPEQIQGALDLLQRQEAAQPAQGSTADLKTRLMRALRSRHGYTEKKTIGGTEGEAVELIGDLVSSVLDDSLVNAAAKPRIQRLEVPLLNVALSDPQFLGSSDHPARRVVNQLSRLHLATDERGEADPQVAAEVDALIDEVMESSGTDPGVYARCARTLDELLGEQQRSRDANIREVVDACEQRKAVAKQPAGDGAPSPLDERTLPAELREWVACAKRLRVGDAVMLGKDTAHPRSAALAWMDDDHSTYAFVDEQGTGTATMSLQELAMALRQGSADVLAESELPAMDRGLYAMLRKMHEGLLEQATREQHHTLIDTRELEARLDKALAAAHADGTRGVLYLLDLDHFHRINETCGRRAGDRLLEELGKVLRRAMGSEGRLARLEDDEFGVLLEKTSEEHAFKVAEKQRGAVEKFQATFKGERMALGVSIGMAGITQESATTGGLLAAATAALETAKKAGGNRIEVYHVPGDASDTAAPGDDWAARVDEVLRDGELVLRCQRIEPIDGSVRMKPHYEILLGVKDGAGKPVVTGEFIQAAETHHRINEVDRRVVEAAFRWMSENKRKLAKLGGCSVNLSGQSLSDESLLEFVLDQFSRTQLPPGKVLFEVTESATIKSLSNAENFIRVLREYGCKFLIDDFGSGHASYSYLKHLPVDYVKIDGMFVKDIADNPNDQAMVKSINEIGHFMGKRTVAEYVENERILEQLREIGVDYAQGFAIEEPRLLRELG